MSTNAKALNAAHINKHLCCSCLFPFSILASDILFGAATINNYHNFIVNTPDVSQAAVSLSLSKLLVSRLTLHYAIKTANMYLVYK